MSTLLVWKDQIEKIYARYSFYIVKILQFVLGLCVFGLINSNIGFMKSIILYSLYSWSCCYYGLSSGRDAGTCSSPACSGTSVCAVFAGSGIMSGNFSGDVYFLCKIYT